MTSLIMRVCIILRYQIVTMLRPPHCLQVQLQEAFRNCLKKYPWLYFIYIPANCTGGWQQIDSVSPGTLQPICRALRLLSPVEP